ncbi:MAG: 1-aminocyclopropane-1-carboxylate deaminase [Pseudopedobacter saltans]|uniref:1-aminocyclopropane-1-carboxylate deaminase n=1 Tax=Pseudopedobacter saltans TaxID=151895 RepID=A0A2W5GS34_9SPHI|nr:MAG: 1-aminocyclopropane-1-carboxylate deaminase [Pseudopedobacter saltans]
MLINQLKNKLRFENILLQTISSFGKLCMEDISVLRLDQLHHQISGNKWFKLQYYFEDFFNSGKRHFATFGGAYSNHIAATATACQLMGIRSIGFIRGERPKIFSPTMELAQQSGMELIFLPRQQYKDKHALISGFPDYYWVPEGGYGKLGVKGAADIWNFVPDMDRYDYVVLPVGSGTTVAGILKASEPHQKILGISVMKNNFSLEAEIEQLVDDPPKMQQLRLLHDYHFGGYAKKNNELLAFMDEVWNSSQLPLDFVYTGKAFYALMDLIDKGELSSSSKILFLHTGGLQGNMSLPDGTLSY